MKKSFKYALVSYCIIFGLTLLIRGIKEKERYQEILSSDFSEIFNIVIVNFGQNIDIAIVPTFVIGLAFCFYVILGQKAD